MSSNSSRVDSTALEEDRRAFYVGATRGRQSLTIIDRLDLGGTLASSLKGSGVLHEARWVARGNPSGPQLDYHYLGLADVHLGYPGRFPSDDRIHDDLRKLQTGDAVRLLLQGDEGIGVVNESGNCVGRLSRSAVRSWGHRLQEIHQVRVLGMVHRDAKREREASRSKAPLTSEWQVPLLEITTRRR